MLLLLLLTPPTTPTSMLRAAVLYMHPKKTSVDEGVEVLGGGVHHELQGACGARRGAPRLLPKHSEAGAVLRAGKETGRGHSRVDAACALILRQSRTSTTVRSE